MVTLIITRLTFLEAVRRRVALAALLLGVAFLILYTLGFHFITHETGLQAEAGPTGSLLRNQVYNFLTNAGLYAVNFLSIAMAALDNRRSLIFAYLTSIAREANTSGKPIEYVPLGS